jgi:branched-chain amino acid transport system permease protein
MQNYLAGFGEWVLVIQGAIFVVTVLLFRRGIVGEIMALGQYLQRRGRSLPATAGATAQEHPAE